MFTHLLRNSLDHGIGAPGGANPQRVKRPPVLFILGTRRDQKLIITLGDDGQGLDIRAFQLGVERGIWSADEMPSADAIAPDYFSLGYFIKRAGDGYFPARCGHGCCKEFLNGQGAVSRLRLDGDTCNPQPEAREHTL